MKKLLILPGATDPSFANYKKRFNLIKNEAYKRGYIDVNLISWIGQATNKTNGLMNLEVASKQFREIIEDYEMQDEGYDVVALSWGANVYLNTMHSFDILNRIGRTVLWGIDEFWRLKEYFLNKEVIEATVASFKTKNTNIDPDFFTYEVPNETLLRDYPHSNQVTIGFGELDEGSPPNFAAYLKTIVQKENISFIILPDLGHVVTEFNQEYIDIIFNS